VKDFPAISSPKTNVHYPLSALAAFFLTAKKLVYSDDMIEDSLQVVIGSFTGKVPTAQLRASVEYGKQVAEQVLHWVAGDHYADTRKMRRYNLLKDEGAWKPTPPGYMAAVEPYWHTIRPLTMDSAQQFRPPAPYIFSRDSSSKFYEQAYEVYRIGKSLSVDETAIANFWDCNPFFLNTGGHLNFATKKISPGGHWMMITGIACIASQADIMKSAAAYTLTSTAIFDGFISCWEEKFRSNLIRPETYINAAIDEDWRPLLQTPPFPEYPSGHSVISTAAAAVLTRLFTDNFSFTDDSEIRFGLPARKFTSFMHASEEAAISRLYGGIHYRAAIENGQLQGRRVGEWVLRKIKLF
jgi:membrane-associated phospholipid phosphatase